MCQIQESAHRPAGRTTLVQEDGRLQSSLTHSSFLLASSLCPGLLSEALYPPMTFPVSLFSTESGLGRPCTRCMHG